MARDEADDGVRGVEFADDSAPKPRSFLGERFLVDGPLRSALTAPSRPRRPTVSLDAGAPDPVDRVRLRPVRRIPT